MIDITVQVKKKKKGEQMLDSLSLQLIQPLSN